MVRERLAFLMIGLAALGVSVAIGSTVIRSMRTREFWIGRFGDKGEVAITEKDRPRAFRSNVRFGAAISVLAAISGVVLLLWPHLNLHW